MPVEILSGLFGAAGSVFNNERNLRAQQEAQDYNKWAQQITWQREDNATQRRVADLRAAGLSPVLAAGSSAQAGSPTKIDPVMSQDALGTEGFISGTTRAAQTQQSIAAAAAATQQVELTKAQTIKTNVDAAVAAKEAGLYDLPGGHPKYQDIWGKRASELMQFLKGSMTDKPKFSSDPATRAKQERALRRSAPFGVLGDIIQGN